MAFGRSFINSLSSSKHSSQLKLLWVEVTEKTMSLSNHLGLLGRKVGMMRLFTDDGDAVPVTVVDVSNNRVTQVKTQENDGYVALQVTFGSRKASRVTKPVAGHLAKAGVEAGEIIQEFRVTADIRCEVRNRRNCACDRRVFSGPKGGRARYFDW